MSIAEYNAYLASTHKKPKYKNKKVYVYVDGYISSAKDIAGHGKIIETYDSKEEFERGRELKLLERVGKIKNLRRQIPLIIREVFRDNNGKTHRAIKYNADFIYEQDGKFIIEDVKGIDRKTGKAKTTETFRIKWKLLQAKYPQYVFRIV